MKIIISIIVALFAVTLVPTQAAADDFYVQVCSDSNLDGHYIAVAAESAEELETLKPYEPFPNSAVGCEAYDRPVNDDTDPTHPVIVDPSRVQECRDEKQTIANQGWRIDRQADRIDNLKAKVKELRRKLRNAR